MARINRLKETESPVNPRDVIAAILTEALPADDERRTFTVLYTAYFALSLTDPALAIAPLVRNSNAVINVVAAQLRAAQAAGGTPAHLDPDTGSRQPPCHVRGPGHERPRRPVLGRAGPGRHRLPPGPPVPRIPASVTPSAHESTSLSRL